ncbi:MAG: hypothetical protein IJ315_01550 [Firmicutes bacterium]|nr:hypothetical protein [Bacillota bacterium]
MPGIETLFDIAGNLQTSIEALFQGADEYYLGIDGGGTKTDLALADREGNILRTLRVKPCNPVDIGLEASKEILKNGIFEICKGIPFSSVYMFAGISGGVSAGMKEKLQEFFSEFRFGGFVNDSDNRNIIAAGLGQQDGMTMILGTGICVYTQKDGKHTKVGGWGYLIDNGGSGYNLGRDALNAYFCALDGSAEKTLLAEEIDALHPGGTQKLMEYIYKEGKKGVASFAPAVFAALEKGDKIAKAILERNMMEAAHLLETGAKQFDLEKIPVILAGGLTKQPRVLEALQQNQRFDIRILDCRPVNGAILLAQQIPKEEE